MGNRPELDIRIIIGSGIFFSIIFLLSVIGIFSNIRMAIIYVVEDQYILINQKIRNLSHVSSILQNLSSLSGENQKYKEEISKLELKVTKLEKQIDDVDYVFKKGIVNFDNTHMTIPVRVLSYDPSGVGIIYINKGSIQDIARNDIVVLREYVVGIVEKVYDNYAIVRIIGDTKVEVNVKTINTNIRGLLRRSTKGNLEIIDINSDATLNIDEIFVTEGKDGIYPYGLYVGKVRKIIGDPSKPTKVAIISNQLEFFNLDRLYVMKLK